MTDYPYTVEEIAGFLRVNARESVGTWTDDILHSHIRWFDSINGLGRSYMAGKLAGVAWARLVENPEDVKFAPDLHHCESGQCVYVDLTVTSHPAAFRGLILIMIKRFGKRLMIAFNRKKHAGRFSVHNWHQFIMKVI